MKAGSTKEFLAVIISFSLLIGYYLILFTFVHFQHPMMDEGLHADQIFAFAKGDFRLSPALAMGPGFHLVLAPLVTLFKIKTIQDLRLLAFLVNLPALPVFYWFAKTVSPKNAALKLLQIGFLPLVAYYTVIIFTDIFSLSLVLACITLILKKKFNLAAIAGSMSLVVRQSNIIWVFFALVLGYAEHYGWAFSESNLTGYIKKVWLFGIVLSGFLIFVIVNRGFAVGAGTKEYSSLAINFNNIFLLILTCGILFIPEVLSAAIKFFRKRNRKVLPAVFVAVTLIALATYTNNHPWNQTDYFIRNRIAVILTWNLWAKIAAFFLVITTLMHLKLTTGKAIPLLYFFAAASVIPIWLIEPRYYMVALVLFLGLRENVSKTATFISLGLQIIMTVYLVNGLRYDLFFL